MRHKCPFGGADVSQWWDTYGTPVLISLLFSLYVFLHMIGGEHGDMQHSSEIKVTADVLRDAGITDRKAAINAAIFTKKPPRMEWLYF